MRWAFDTGGKSETRWLIKSIIGMAVGERRESSRKRAKRLYRETYKNGLRRSPEMSRLPPSDAALKLQTEAMPIPKDKKGKMPLSFGTTSKGRKR